MIPLFSFTRLPKHRRTLQSHQGHAPFVARVRTDCPRASAYVPPDSCPESAFFSLPGEAWVWFSPPSSFVTLIVGFLSFHAGHLSLKRTRDNGAPHFHSNLVPLIPGRATDSCPVSGFRPRTRMPRGSGFIACGPLSLPSPPPLTCSFRCRS